MMPLFVANCSLLLTLDLGGFVGSTLVQISHTVAMIWPFKSIPVLLLYDSEG